jgi:two-component system CheB/CheR fusion protein
MPKTSSVKKSTTQPRTSVRSQVTTTASRSSKEQSLVARSFPVAGVGASAGGLEAFTALLHHLPPNTGIAFVLVQHLDPKHESILAEILARETSMPVHEAREAIAVRPNEVYVIPSDRDMIIQNGKLNLVKRMQTHNLHMPIDYFFRSLAEDQKSNAIGIILSGTGTDGTLGLRAIKAESGLTFAQDEKSARYDGMPRSAITAGVVDFVMPPEAIAKELARFARQSYRVIAKARPEDEVMLEGEDDLSKIFLMLRATNGVDFSTYKPTTIKRRVARRMLLNKISDLPTYIKFIKDNPREIEELFQDLLINVTGFFREPDLFEVLKKKVFPKLMKDRVSQNPLRIWVPGCSTGEEAYSLAICLLEYLGDALAQTPVQIFATDVSEAAIEKARAGIYVDNIAQDVSPERLRRFFVKTDGNYHVTKAVRDMCVFAKQDITRDPPFSKIDLISCRNLLIYLNSAMQKRIISTFHYALRPNGYLILGSSETIGNAVELFSLSDKKHKIYTRKHAPPRFDFAISEPSLHKLEPGKPVAETAAGFDPQKEVDRILLSRYAPSGVLINETMDILQFRGQTGKYLEPAAGAPNVNVLKMAREGLAYELRTTIQEARKQNAPVRRTGVRVKSNGGVHSVNLHVIPINLPNSAERYYLILFEEPLASRRAELAEAKVAAKNASPLKRGKTEQQLAQLQQELALTKEYLQSTIEQLETTNEELRSALEEVQSSNEELQSTNEELETAKEELQSTNEELTTVNEELQNRNIELTQLNNDSMNLINSANIPIIILGVDLRIRRYTPMAEKVFNLIPTDIGRPISDLRLNIIVPDLEKIVLDVMDRLDIREIEVRDRDGHWYLMRIRPFKTIDNKIEGVLIACFDIDVLKFNLSQMVFMEKYANALIEMVPVPMVVLDKMYLVKSANELFYQTWWIKPEDLQGCSLFDVPPLNSPPLRQAIENMSSHKLRIENLDIELSPGARPQRAIVNARLVMQDDGTFITLLTLKPNEESSK